MPRLKHLQPLYNLTLHQIVDIVAELCFRSTSETEEEAKDNAEAVSRFVREIPPFAVKKYMKNLLALADELHNENVQENYLRAALHPECRTLKIGCLSDDLEIALVKNMDVMTRLQKLEVTFSPSDSEWNADRCLAKNICHLRELRSVSLADLCSREVLLSIIKNCPYIEKLEIQFRNYDINVPRALSKCQGIKWLNVSFRNCVYRNVEHVMETTNIHLLDRLPNLEYVHLENIARFLDTVEILAYGKQFRIRSFGSKISNDDDLEMVCSYFPALEEIRLRKIRDYSPITTLTNLKKLEVDDRFDCFKNFPAVISFCSQLTSCVLEDVSLTEIFQSGQEVTFPVLVTLKLCECIHVDISEVAVHCPNLTKFECCSSIIELPLPILKSHQPFRHLKSLKVEVDMPSHVLFMLSSCLELRYLQLLSNYEMTLLTNDVFKSVLQNNPLEKLQLLEISSDGLTKDIVPLILESLSSLKDLFLTGLQLNLSCSEREELDRQLMPFDLNCVICP